MNVVVCVKQIPDPAVPGELDSDHTLNGDLVQGLPKRPVHGDQGGSEIGGAQHHHWASHTGPRLAGPPITPTRLLRKPAAAVTSLITPDDLT